MLSLGNPRSDSSVLEEEEASYLEDVTKRITESYNLKRLKQIEKKKESVHIFQNKIEFTAKELSKIKAHFKYASEKLMVFHDGIDNSWDLFKTIGLHEWMTLCKGMGVFEFFAGARDLVRTISSLFKRNANQNNKLNFEGFCNAFGMLVETMANFKEGESYEKRVQTSKEFLGIYAGFDNVQKLEKIGFRKIKPEEIAFLNRRKKHRSLDNTFRKKTNETVSEYSTGRKSLENLKSNDSLYERINHSTSLAIKRYQKEGQEIRRNVLKTLEASSISNLLPKQELEKSLREFLTEDQVFLKNYEKKKKLIKDGIMKKLQKEENKYTTGNKPMKKKSKVRKDKSEIFDF